MERTLEEIKQLPLGTKLYVPGDTDIQWWYYAGINPVADKYIMLVSAGNVAKMHSEYINYEWRRREYYLEYEEACQKLLENAKQNVEKVQRIFIDKK